MDLHSLGVAKTLRVSGNLRHFVYRAYQLYLLSIAEFFDVSRGWIDKIQFQLSPRTFTLLCWPKEGFMLDLSPCPIIPRSIHPE